MGGEGRWRGVEGGGGGVDLKNNMWSLIYSEKRVISPLARSSLS